MAQPANEVRPIDRLSSLRFDDQGSMKRLPAWCKFFISLGAELAAYKKEETKIVIAFSVPTRAFCATFLSLGYLGAGIGDHFRNSTVEYIDQIKALPVGSPVLFTSGNGKQYKAVFEGLERSYFVVRTDEEQSTEHFVNFDRAWAIELFEGEDFVLPKREKYLSAPISPLLSSVFGKHLATAFVNLSKIELAIVSTLRLLKHEICDQQFALNGQLGNLQEFIRVRQFGGKRGTHKSFAVSDKSLTEQRSMVVKPGLTIFDGSQSFLKWRALWPQSNMFVILDQTENQFYSAVNQINSDFIQKRIDDSAKISIPPIPDGIEVMIFEVRHEGL